MQWLRRAFAGPTASDSSQALEGEEEVEAKINASERREQLADYERALEAQFRHRTVLRVFLTPQARASRTRGRGDWHALGYARLAACLWEAARDRPTAEGFHFLRYYLAGVFQDVLGWPRLGDTVDCETRVNPYHLLDCLRTAAPRPGGATP